MKVILEGEERVVNTIIRENRVRVSRGQVSFSPADSTPTPEGVTEEDLVNMKEAFERQDAKIAKLEEENETLKAALAEKENADAPEKPDTKEGEGEGDSDPDKEDNKEGGESDTTDAPQEDSKDAPQEDSKEAEETPDTKGKKTSKK